MGGINSEYTGQTPHSPQAVPDEGLHAPHIDYNPRLGRWYSTSPGIGRGEAQRLAQLRGLQYNWSGEHAGKVTANPDLAERAMRAGAK